MDEENILKERQADYQVYSATGTHREIGIATALKGGGLLRLGEALSEDRRRFAEACRELVGKFYPEMLEEFGGYAEALQVPEEELLWHYTLGVQGGCSAMAVRRPEGMRVGRNYDFFYFEDRRHLIDTRPRSGHAHIGMHEGLIGGRFDGINEKGLFVSFNGAGPHPDPATPGIAFHLIVRYLLEKCSDVQEARDALLQLPVKEPKSYLVADPNDAFVAEVHPSRREVRWMEKDVLIVTNHFVHPSMAPYQPEWPNSAARYRRLESISRAAVENADGMAVLQAALRDHEAPVCGHEDGLATFWSCMANPNARDIRYSLGAPCRNEYRRYFKF